MKYYLSHFDTTFLTILCYVHQTPAYGGTKTRRKNAYETTNPLDKKNSTAFPWQHRAVIWRLASHGCVSLPHRPPLCLTDGSCDCNHPSYCQRRNKKKKRGQERGNHTQHLFLAPLCPTNKPPHCEQKLHMDHRPLSSAVHVHDPFRGKCVGVHLWFACACPLACRISHWSVHRGAADMSHLAADQKHQRLVPLWPGKRASYQHVSLQ